MTMTLLVQSYGALAFGTPAEIAAVYKSDKARIAASTQVPRSWLRIAADDVRVETRRGCVERIDKLHDQRWS